MSTVNFSAPEKVKQAFNETFQGQNKSGYRNRTDAGRKLKTPCVACNKQCV